MPYMEYAKAMLSLALEENKLDVFSDCFHVVNDLAKANPDFIKLMSAYSISNKDKKKLLLELLKDLDKEFMNFLFVLIDNNRFRDFKDIYDGFKELLQEKNNIMRVVITSPAKLTEARLNKITKALSLKYEGKKIIINNEIDESLIGGFKIYYNGDELDASISRQLGDMRNLLWKG